MISPCFDMDFSFMLYPTFVLQYLRAYCSYCTQMALLGIRHHDIVRGHDTCQVGFAFVLVLQNSVIPCDPSELRSEG